MKTIIISFATAVFLIATSFSAFAQVTPSGGSTDRPILPGGTTPIRWSTFVDSPGLVLTHNVDIYLWNGSTSQKTLIASNIPATRGEYQWVVPPSIVGGEKYRIVAESSVDRDRRFMSAGWVKIGVPTLQRDASKGLLDAPSELGAPTVHAIRVSPQPAREVASIVFDSDYQTVQIVGIDGKLAAQRSLQPNQRSVEFGVSDIAAGVYTVVLTSAEGLTKTAALRIVP